MDILKELFTRAVITILPEHSHESVKITIGKQSDYQCNDSMRLAKKLKKNPRDIAQQIIDNLPTNGIISETSVSGPGFINITLSPEYTRQSVMQILIGRNPILQRSRHPQKVIVEYSSPNIAKALHVGHLRSTIIGDSLANVMELLGHSVLRINHIGDWGTQFGVLLAYIKKHDIDYNTLTIEQLSQLYREAKKCDSEEPEFKARARQEVVKMQAGDKLNNEIRRKITDVSMAAIRGIYSRLGIDERFSHSYKSNYFSSPTPLNLYEGFGGVIGESYYKHHIQNCGKHKLQHLLDLEELIVENDGAKIINTSSGVPLFIFKSDGSYGYDLTDICALRERVGNYVDDYRPICVADTFNKDRRHLRADQVYYVVDKGQSQHLENVFEVGRKVGWCNDEPRHVAFGVVLGEDGKRMKARSGEPVTLTSLLDRAVEHAKVVLLEKNPHLPSEQMAKIADTIGIAVVKYYDLKQNRLSDYKLSFEAMTSFTGNTAVYLLYSYARICGIIRECTIRTTMDMLLKYSFPSFDPKHPVELKLCKILLKFNDVIHDTAETQQLYYITDLLYEISVNFNKFYNNCTVKGSTEQVSRLLLCQAVKITMEQLFELLGITPLERI